MKLDKLIAMFSNLFGWLGAKTEAGEILDEKARDIADMAHATEEVEESEHKKAKLDLKTYRKEQKLRKRQEKDIEKAAAKRLGISVKEFRRRNKKLKQANHL